MRAAVLGRSPGELNFAMSPKACGLLQHVLMTERNRRYGAGTLVSLGLVSTRSIRKYFTRWNSISVCYRRVVRVSGKHGFCRQEGLAHSARKRRRSAHAFSWNSRPTRSTFSKRHNDPSSLPTGWRRVRQYCGLGMAIIEHPAGPI